MIKIKLPFPPSSNNMYATDFKTKRRFKTKKFEQWLKDCPDLPDVKTTGLVKVEYIFAWPTAHKRDGQSYMKAPLDYLVKQGIFTDDNWQVVSGETWGHVGIDKENPRVEIIIKNIVD